MKTLSTNQGVKMDRAKMASRIANFIMESAEGGYEPKSALEKVMGQILSQQMGITDAPESVFKKATGKFFASMREEGLKFDLKNPKIYPLINAALAEVV
jgi:hypothetical protein